MTRSFGHERPCSGATVRDRPRALSESCFAARALLPVAFRGQRLSPKAYKLASASHGRGGSMIDHMGITVRSHAQSKAFYLAALTPLGIGVVMEVGKELTGAPSDYTGFGSNDKPYFWVG